LLGTARVATVAAAAAAICMALAGCVSAGAAETRCGDFRFDSAAWKRDASGARHGTTVRQRLADGLARCHTLDGRSRAEVRRLLGPRERNSGRHIWTYQTGPERSGFHMGFEELSVHFGRDGRVSSVEIWTA
jgi:hypothetical protein